MTMQGRLGGGLRILAVLFRVRRVITFYFDMGLSFYLRSAGGVQSWDC